MWEELWRSELTKTPEPINDVKIELFVPRGKAKPIMYIVRVYRTQNGDLRLLDATYPGGLPVNKLPRGAKRELRRVFPLAVLML